MTKTVRVRIAIEVDEHGNYSAFGSSIDDLDPHLVVREWSDFGVDTVTEELWIEADVPVPKSAAERVIKGEVRDG